MPTALLNPIQGKNRYCGPAALATILGVTTDHAARVIRGFSNERWVKGVTVDHMAMAMAQLGVQARYTRIDAAYGLGTANESLADWLHHHVQLFQGSHLILVFGVAGDSHYGTISGGMYQCSLSKIPVALDAIPFKPSTGIVFGIFEVQDRPLTTPKDEKLVARGMLARARRIASRCGVVIECSADGSWFEVWCPELDDDDPLEGKNSTDDVRVVLELVEEYRYCLENGYLEAVTDPAFAWCAGSFGRDVESSSAINST